MSALKGSLGGVAIGLLVVALVQYGIPEKYGVESITNFLAAAPLYLAAMAKLADNKQLLIFYFAYWILVGGLLGWLLSQKLIGKLIGLLALGGVLYAHYQTYLLLGAALGKQIPSF